MIDGQNLSTQRSSLAGRFGLNPLPFRPICDGLFILSLCPLFSTFVLCQCLSGFQPLVTDVNCPGYIGHTKLSHHGQIVNPAKYDMCSSRSYKDTAGSGKDVSGSEFALCRIIGIGGVQDEIWIRIHHATMFNTLVRLGTVCKNVLYNDSSSSNWAAEEYG